MRIDLHAHSNVSDGTEKPADVMASAARAGLDVVALTDHDTTAGWADAAAEATRTGVTVVLGSEISARWRGVSVHLLSYLQDPEHPALRVEVERTRSARLSRSQGRVRAGAKRSTQLSGGASKTASGLSVWLCIASRPSWLRSDCS